MQGSARVVVWLFAAVCVAGCSIGAPPGFSGGESWVLPLVGPLEDGLLVTPVSVNGHGPYLFAIDPDAAISAVDASVVQEAHLWNGQGPRRVDETDTTRPRVYAELLDVKLANLTIDRRDAMVFPVGTYDTEGRHISGILGRDALADSLVFGFDRDQGVAILSTVSAFHAPADAISIKYDMAGVNRPRTPGERPLWQGGRGARVPAVPRRVATAEINGHAFTMHLDLGGPVSQLAESSWSKAGLAPTAVKLRLLDEVGTSREVVKAGVAATVTLGATQRSEIAFAPYIERRFEFLHIDGALGLDFFRPFSVFLSWDRQTYYLKPRGDVAAATTARLGRWGADVPACPHPGCVTAEVIATATGAELHVVRDAQAANHDLEVLLAATTDGGRSAVPLVVELPGSADQVTSPMPPAYTGATLTVLDVSPFPRACPAPGGCVRQFAEPAAPETTPEPAGAIRTAARDPR